MEDCAHCERIAVVVQVAIACASRRRPDGRVLPLSALVVAPACAVLCACDAQLNAAYARTTVVGRPRGESLKVVPHLELLS